MSTSFLHMHQRRRSNVCMKFKMSGKGITYIQSKMVRQSLTSTPRKRNCSQKSNDFRGWPGEEDAWVFVSWSLVEDYFIQSLVPKMRLTARKINVYILSFINSTGCFLDVDLTKDMMHFVEEMLLLFSWHFILSPGFYSFSKALSSFSAQLLYINEPCSANTVFLMTKALKSLRAISEHWWSSRGQWM